jgi:hydrogenase maturation protease
MDRTLVSIRSARSGTSRCPAVIAAPPPVLIAALGNPLMGDDGAGAAVIAALRARRLPRYVHTTDLGTDSLRLPGDWTGEPRVWLVDALLRDAPPGSVHVLEHEEVLALPPSPGSAHHQNLALNLRWIVHSFPAMADVRFRLWGIEPETVSPRCGLSPAVRQAVRRATMAIRSQVAGSRHTACE